MASRDQFDRELEATGAKVIELSGMVAEDLRAATQALLTGSSTGHRRPATIVSIC